MGDFPERKEIMTIPMAEFRKALLGGDSVADAMSEERCIQPDIGCGKKLAETIADQDRMRGTWFRDSPSITEYRITGLCQQCQDDIQAQAEEAEGAYDESYPIDYGFIQGQGEDYLDQD